MRKIQPVDSMERISRQYLVENMDEILDRITNEDIGMVITEDGKDDLVICPYSWYSPYDDDDFGCIVTVRFGMRCTQRMKTSKQSFNL